MAPPKAKVPDLPAELEISAVFCNRAKVNLSNLGVRVAFGESTDGSETNEKFTQAVFIPHPVFVGVVDLFNNIKAQAEKLLAPQVEN